MIHFSRPIITSFLIEQTIADWVSERIRGALLARQ